MMPVILESTNLSKYSSEKNAGINEQFFKFFFFVVNAVQSNVVHAFINRQDLQHTYYAKKNILH